jgi:hypothetical protein
VTYCRCALRPLEPGSSEASSSSSGGGGDVSGGRSHEEHAIQEAAGQRGAKENQEPLAKEQQAKGLAGRQGQASAAVPALPAPTRVRRSRKTNYGL